MTSNEIPPVQAPPASKTTAGRLIRGHALPVAVIVLGLPVLWWVSGLINRGLSGGPVTPPGTTRLFTHSFGWHLLLYFGAASPAYAVFHVLLKRYFAARRIQQREADGTAIRRDILFSLSSVIIFALVGLATHHMAWSGWTKLYLQIDRYGWGYFGFSLLAMIVLHDTWFYWTHRLMHWRRLFPIMHRVHHLSHTPTPWSALAFHPTEAVVQAVIFPIAALVLPMHPLVAVLWLAYMIVINVWGHLGVELLPAGFRRHRLFRWHNTTTHHDMHHRHLTGNYGLYFNFWDRVMGTNHRDYEE
jgi:sterol desaturase/sphingolipid hydroxylase (fatty acid hydroxylase superfamily)